MNDILLQPAIRQLEILLEGNNGVLAKNRAESEGLSAELSRRRRAAWEAAHKGLLVVDQAGAVIVNRGYLRRLGASQAEIAGLKRGLLVKARTPNGGRFRPDPRLLAAHWERWNVQSG